MNLSVQHLALRLMLLSPGHRKGTSGRRVLPLLRSCMSETPSMISFRGYGAEETGLGLGLRLGSETSLLELFFQRLWSHILK